MNADWRSEVLVVPVENRPEERARLEASAWHALEYPELQEPRVVVRHPHPLLRVWRHPAYFAQISLMAFDPLDAAGMLHIRQVRWNMPADMARFADPFDGVRQGCSAPLTLCVRDASLPDALLHEHLRALRRIPIPVAGIEAPVVLHGEGCGLRFYAPPWRCGDVVG